MTKQRGCCVNEVGDFDRALCVRNFFHATIACGILGGLCNIVPAKSRWLSCSVAMAMVSAGVLLFSLLPRAWRLAFGEWSIPRGLEGDDYHIMVRSKAYRAKLWFCQADMAFKTIMYLVLAAPAEQLLQKIQSFDARGSILKDLAVDATNPILICCKKYMQFIL